MAQGSGGREFGGIEGHPRFEDKHPAMGMPTAASAAASHVLLVAVEERWDPDDDWILAAELTPQANPDPATPALKVDTGTLAWPQ